MKNFAKHLPHYFALFGVLFLGALAFYLFSYDRAFQAAVAVAVAIAYVAWGTVHHSIHRDLHLSVFIEYLLVAALGLVIVFSLMFRT
ncbi:MAG: hypothetical protein UX03_C0030G0016 [Candidatus Woesebacteria bacterium GW2011_GWE1_45_18]|uniref:Uncharacterized protein n=2 Tax=Candidatus Woeseibacteriota TaxID=1752722 RepID=A0A1F8DFJ8_9BACT|nr:MAG: hypothetical protein UX03_C0030G0016 [Candidatus Woesebacteria bacterium GW2011_GWE1_45_18]OGM86545.1 MAG: hypothetical protein A2435_02175 [Candidatus Woesebacteria bacterium RIFOXYC1_FULL_46_16]